MPLSGSRSSALGLATAFARWRISELVTFREAVGAGGTDAAQVRLDRILNAAIREVLGSVPSNRVLSEDRTALMNQIRDIARLYANAERAMIQNFDELPSVMDVYARDLTIENYFIGYLKHPYGVTPEAE